MSKWQACEFQQQCPFLPNRLMPTSLKTKQIAKFAQALWRIQMNKSKTKGEHTTNQIWASILAVTTSLQ
jgi:hypothetical protein